MPRTNRQRTGVYRSDGIGDFRSEALMQMQQEVTGPATQPLREPNPEIIAMISSVRSWQDGADITFPDRDEK